MKQILVANRNKGLGDALSVYSVLDEERSDILVFANSGSFHELLRFNPHARAPGKDWSNLNLVDCTKVQQPDPANLGLHLFQKIRKAAGLDYSQPPRPFLFPAAVPKDARPTVCCSFDVGGAAAAERDFAHPRAREFYPEHRASFQKVVDELAGKLRFVDVGAACAGFANVEDRSGLPIAQVIGTMQRCHAYFGVHSGLMHVAAALRLPSVIVLNFPAPELIRFPYEEHAYHIDWLYPYNTHLHEDRGAGAVRLVSYASVMESIRALVRL
jgi:hypothetical protein